jgi:hypothetical protein
MSHKNSKYETVNDFVCRVYTKRRCFCTRQNGQEDGSEDGQKDGYEKRPHDDEEW